MTRRPSCHPEERSDEGSRPPRCFLVPLNFYAYILTNASRTLYIGVTNDLRRRISQHRLGLGGEFTKKYHCRTLVWYAHFGQVNDAIAAEKKIEGWSRAKKIALIEKENPEWRDLMPET